MANMISGIASIKMLKELFGIDQTCVSSITVTATVGDSTLIDVKSFAKEVDADVEVNKESNTRYIVDIKKVIHGNDND